MIANVDYVFAELKNQLKPFLKYDFVKRKQAAHMVKLPKRH